MKTSLTKLIARIAAPAALSVLLIAPSCMHAQAAAADQDHIVSSQNLQQQVETSSATRQKNIDTLNEFVSTPTAIKAMHDAKIDPQQVKSAIPSLSDKDLANLSARATKANSDFSAGYIGPGMFTLIILAVVLIIIIIVIH